MPKGREQAAAGLTGTESGSAPEHVWSASTLGFPVIVHSSSGRMAPSDVTPARQRRLWTRTPFRVGQSGELDLDFGPAHAGDTYQCAMSVGYRPGISFGAAGTVHLQAGDFFVIASILGLDGGAVWKNFGGTLDAEGVAGPSPRVDLPAIPSLRGMRFYFGAVVLNPFEGVRAVSNLCGITVE